MQGVYFVGTQKSVKSEIDSLKDLGTQLKGPGAIVYLLDPKNNVDIDSLKLAINANLGRSYLDLRKVAKIGEIQGDLDRAIIIEKNSTKPFGGFRVLNTHDLFYTIDGDWYGDSWAGQKVRVPILEQ